MRLAITPTSGGTAVADGRFGTTKHLLDPVERASEVLFGLIMVLTCTGSLSVAGAGRAEVRTMLLGALGCNLAWGIIDAVFYLMGCLAESAGKLKVYNTVRASADPEEATGRFPGAAADGRVRDPARGAGGVAGPLKALPKPPDSGFLSRSDWRGALGVSHPRVPLHVPGDDPVPLHEGRHAGAAHLQRHRNRAAVRDRPHLRALGRRHPVGQDRHGPTRGGPGSLTIALGGSP